MYNPFKNNYKIVESSTLDGAKHYNVAFCNFFTQFLPVAKWLKVYRCGNYSLLMDMSHGGGYDSLENVKLAIKAHQEKLLTERLAKITTKTIARI